VPARAGKGQKPSFKFNKGGTFRQFVKGCSRGAKQFDICKGSKRKVGGGGKGATTSSHNFIREAKIDVNLPGIAGPELGFLGSQGAPGDRNSRNPGI